MAPSAEDAAGVYLRSYMAPLAEFLERDDVTDIYVNRPGELWVEAVGGGIEQHSVPALDTVVLDRLSHQVAALAHQGISREHPLLSATLPGGARIQIIAPPATRGPLALAIRKHISADLSLLDYAAAGAFARTRHAPALDPIDQSLADLFAKGDMPGLLALAVRSRKNILISGGTSTG